MLHVAAMAVAVTAAEAVVATVAVTAVETVVADINLKKQPTIYNV